MAKKEKLKRIISHENLDPAILEMFNKKYPNGYNGFIQNIPSPKGEMMHVVPLETEDSIFLVKVKVQANKKGRGNDEEDDDFFGDDIPEAGDGFDGDKDEFGNNDDEDDNYGDGPAEESDDEEEDED